MRRKLNVRLLGWFLGGLLLTGVTVHILHAHQVRRNAGALLQQAERALEGGHLGQAAGYFGHYLGYEPGDTSALARYGFTLQKLAATGSARERVLSLFNQVLRRDPSRDDVREGAAVVSMQLYRFEEAAQHLQVLLTKSPKRPDLNFRMGWCQEVNGDYAKAAAFFKEDVKLDPGHLAGYERLATVLAYKLELPTQAAQVLDGMISANPKSAEAFLLRARYRRAAGAETDAWKDVARATELEPGRVDVLLAAAEQAHARGDTEAARAHLRRGLQLHASNPTFYTAAAALEWGAGRRAEALACLRRGLARMPQSGELLAALAGLLVEGGTPEEATAAVKELRNQGSAPAQADVLEARLLMRRGRWEDALTLLEQARWRLAGAGQSVGQADLLQARCHEHMGDTDQQLAACRRAAVSDPAWPAARLALGSALLQADRAGAALVELRALAAGKEPPDETWPLLARALLTRNLSLPEAQRDWDEVERALDRAARTEPASAEVAILRAEALAARGQFVSAGELLVKALQRHPREARLWAARADLAMRQGKSEGAAATLREARQTLGELLPLSLAWLRYWAGQGDLAARQQLLKMADEPSGLPPDEEPRFLRELGDTLYRAGEPAAAGRLWRSLAERHPKDLRSRFALFELALAKGDQAGQRQMLDDLRRVEGDEGVLWRYGEAAHLLQLSTREGPGGLGQARKYLDEAEARQRGWGRVALLQAAVAEAEGNPERAIEHYLRALQLGECPPRAVSRVVRLLYERRRYVEAEQALRRAEKAGTLDKDMARLAVELAFLSRNLGRALTLARQIAPPEGRDYRDQLWLAQVLTRAGRHAETEETLRRAVGGSPDIPDVWVALVQYLVARGRQGEAADVLKELARRLPPERVLLTLARCHEALEDVARAEQFYAEAMKERPEDFMARKAAADFYLRTGQASRAESLLRALIDPAAGAPLEIVARARRQLAVSLAASPRPADFQEALLLLDRNDQFGGRSAEDDRTRAAVLATRPERRGEALKLLERSQTREPLTGAEQFLLVQLLEAQGNGTQARELMLRLLAADDRNPDFLAHYVRTLVERRELTEARYYFDRLEQIQPHAPRTAELKAALERAQAVNAARGR